MLTFKHITLVSCIPFVLLADGLVIKTGQIQEFYPGDDGTYKIGIERGYTRSDAGIVTDQATGLEWHDSYRGGVVKSGKMSDAVAYCSSLLHDENADWRVPSYKELRSIIDYSHTTYDNAAMTNDIFESIVTGEWEEKAKYWTSTDDAYNTPGLAFHIIDFKWGSDATRAGEGEVGTLPYVRCVRGNSLQTLTFERNATLEVVYDDQNNLTWQDNEIVATQALAWSDAIDYCETLVFAQSDDWRLPNVNAYNTITDRNRYGPAINTAFDNTVALESLGLYWTSTGYGDESSKWFVSSNSGSMGMHGSSNLNYARCVRTGEIIPLPNTAPIAYAGEDQDGVIGDEVILNGSGTDTDGDTITYSWTLTSPTGSSSTLAGPLTATPSFTPDTAGTYEATLIVYDGYDYSTPDSAIITVVSIPDAATNTVEETIDAVNAMDPAIFSNPNIGNALTNKLNSILDLIAAGEYQEALDKLNNDILPKTDGCTLRGEPDKQDWIDDCAEQEVVYDYVMKIIERLESLI